MSNKSFGLRIQERARILLKALLNYEDEIKNDPTLKPDFEKFLKKGLGNGNSSGYDQRQKSIFRVTTDNKSVRIFEVTLYSLSQLTAFCGNQDQKKLTEKEVIDAIKLFSKFDILEQESTQGTTTRKLIFRYQNQQDILNNFENKCTQWNKEHGRGKNQSIDTLSYDSIKGKAKVLISYATQNSSFRLAQEFSKALETTDCQVFMAGENIHSINAELTICDYFILFLSPESVGSEIVLERVSLARNNYDINNKPKIVAIKIDLQRLPLSYDLRCFLENIPQLEWTSPTDTPALIKDILQVIAENKILPVIDAYTNESKQPKVAHQTGILPPLPVAEPEFPEGQVDLASEFYVERPPVESNCYQTILKPGSLIRIKAPRQMGKTSLMARILYQARQQDYQTVSLSFQILDRKDFTDLNTFLQRFCASVARRLNLPHKIADYWDDIFGSKDNCTAYFEEYLLSEISSPLVLGLDEVDCIFQDPEIATDFFGLLRAWHEEAKSRDIWKKLRLVVVHSTEVYIPLNTNQSPFNVGLPIELPEFNFEQVLNLAQRHGLDWNINQVEQLMALIGGHPYLIRVAFYNIICQKVMFETLLHTAATEEGLYSDHLRRHLWNLEQHPELAEAFGQVVAATSPVQLPSMQAFKLQSMGLALLQRNEVMPRCNLYRQYFCTRL